MPAADDATLPSFVRAAVTAPADDRPVPELGLGDEGAAVALVVVTRALLAADTVEDVVVAIVRLVIGLGGTLTVTPQAPGVVPLDLSFGTGSVLFAAADPLSVARMRLGQMLPRAVEDARTSVARIRHEQELAAAAGSDALTGLLSRRQLLRTLATAQPGDVMVVVDVDGLNAVNERYGRDRGDEVLQALGAFLSAAVRPDDVVGRYGGDEVVVLLRGISPRAAARRVSELRERWQQAAPLPVTLSVGLAPVDATGWASAVRRAETETYDDKRRRGGGAPA